MEIYADVVFAINFFMDMFILWVASKLAHKKLKPLRLVLGGFVMAFVYCLIIFVAPLHMFLNIFANVVILMIGVVIAFKPETVKQFLKIIAFSYVSAFALGGISVAFFYFTNITDVVGNMIGFTVENFSVKILLASTCAFYIIIKLSLNWYKRIIIKKQVFYPIKIFLEDNDVILTALVDTGNSLVDPLSNNPVIIAEFNAIKNFLPDSVKLIFYENNEDNLENILMNTQGTTFGGRIRMIPFASIGKENGLLIGFRPDKVEIEYEDDTKTLKDVIIGIYNCTLSKDLAYQGLLNPALVES